MNRLGLLKPDELSPEQQKTYQFTEEYLQGAFSSGKFVVRDEQKRFVGPFGIELHYPEVAQAFYNFSASLKKIPGLEAPVRECAILGVGSRFHAAYEEYAHGHTSGFAKEDLESMHNGHIPDHFSPEQKIAFKVATELGGKGPLPAATWEEAVKLLGKDGAAAVVHYTGFYSYVCCILNGFDAKIPE